MFHKIIAWSILFTMFSMSSCKTSLRSTRVVSSDHAIQYMGRIEHKIDGSKTLIWSGTSASIPISGSNISVILKDETGDNFYNLIVDDKVVDIIVPDTTITSYKIKNLTAGKHIVTLFKRTEYNRGNTVFYGFELGENTKSLPALPSKTKEIIFYGNSISAGYSISDYSGKDSPDSIYTNNFLAYSALTARHYDAEYKCICKSGIGVVISWFPTVMSDIYNRLDPKIKTSRWDFANDNPDVVVVNLFQNDSKLIHKPELEIFKSTFGDTPPTEEFIVDAYQNFISNIRKAHPSASIICALGSMDATKAESIWPSYISQAVENINDDKIYTFFFPYKKTSGHPKTEEQKIMSEQLIAFIDKNIHW